MREQERREAAMGPAAIAAGRRQLGGCTRERGAAA